LIVSIKSLKFFLFFDSVIQNKLRICTILVQNSVIQNKLRICTKCTKIFISGLVFIMKIWKPCRCPNIQQYITFFFPAFMTSFYCGKMYVTYFHHCSRFTVCHSGTLNTFPVLLLCSHHYDLFPFCVPLSNTFSSPQKRTSYPLSRPSPAAPGDHNLLSVPVELPI